MKGSKTLKMVKKATIEKLTSKILRNYMEDISITLPFLLLLALMFRRAANDEMNQCSRQVAWWLLIYFSTVVLYSHLKLIKICVLRAKSVPVSSYIKFWLIMAGVYYFLMFIWFCYGISVMYNVIAVCPHTDDHGGPLDNPDYYDSVTLKILMFGILILYWILVLLLI